MTTPDFKDISPEGAHTNSNISMNALLKTILRIDVELIRRAKMSSARKWTSAVSRRLVPVRDEISKRADNTSVGSETFNYILQMLLDAIPTPNTGIDAAFRAYYYEALLEMKPKSIAARRHLARAYEQLESFDAAKICLAQLVRQTKDPTFSQRLETVAAYIKIRDAMMDQLCCNKVFLAAIGCVADPPVSLSDREAREVLCECFARDPLCFLAPLAVHCDQGMQFLFSEALCYRRMIVHGRPSNLTEDQLISAFDLRDFVQGKTICVVANSGSLLDAHYGAFIDNHDVVIRFNSFAIDPPHTGTKTTIHCSIHLKDHNRDVVVPIRLIMGNVSAPWVQTLTRLRGRAQQFVGDDTLKYPLYAQGLVDERMEDAAPTMGYNILRLLHLYSNFKHLHLVGFDGYKSGAYRTAEGMREPLAAIHDSSQEDIWIEANTTAVDTHILRMIPLAAPEGA